MRVKAVELRFGRAINWKIIMKSSQTKSDEVIRSKLDCIFYSNISIEREATVGGAKQSKK